VPELEGDWVAGVSDVLDEVVLDEVVLVAVVLVAVVLAAVVELALLVGVLVELLLDVLETPSAPADESVRV
jgi:hypothetical protein